MISKKSIKIFVISFVLLIAFGFVNYGVSVEGVNGMADISSRYWIMKLIGYSALLAGTLTAAVMIVRGILQQGKRKISDKK